MAVVIDDRHKHHQLRQGHVPPRPMPAPAPQAWSLQPVEIPPWQRPSPRAGRVLAMAYHRRHHRVRAVCRWLPFLIPIARAAL